MTKVAILPPKKRKNLRKRSIKSTKAPKKDIEIEALTRGEVLRSAPKGALIDLPNVGVLRGNDGQVQRENVLVRIEDVQARIENALAQKEDVQARIEDVQARIENV